MNEIAIRGFECFDLQRRSWSTLRCVGEDPFPISEYCMLPINEGQSEPNTILFYGGYIEKGNTTELKHSEEDSEKMFGDDFKEVLRPYQRRLLRLDLNTMIWTKLAATRDDLMPAGKF